MTKEEQKRVEEIRERIATVRAIPEKYTRSHYEADCGTLRTLLDKAELLIRAYEKANDRAYARAQNDFARSDELRSEINDMGFYITDGSDNRYWLMHVETEAKRLIEQHEKGGDV